MGKGHIKNPKSLSCATCNSEFIGKHYNSKYCSETCAQQNTYSRNRIKILNKGYQLWAVYKLTIDDFEQMQKDQNYCCAICKRDTKKFYVDHCHTTNKVRGLLCMNCNTGLGHFQDNQDWLNNAISYLKQTELKKTREV